MRARELVPGQIGVDLDSPLSAKQCHDLQTARGASFAVRYLSELTAIEGEAITGAGWGLMGVTHPRGTLSDTFGQADGVTAASHARAVGLPEGIHLWLDLESWSGDAIGYVNAWAAQVTSAGYLAGLYVGYADAPLTPDELYDLDVQAYWKSCSEVPEVAHASYMMIQLTPPDLVIAGTLVDLDVVQGDRKGRLPVAAFAA